MPPSSQRPSSPQASPQDPRRRLSELPALEGYRVLRELERGGMGEILLARDIAADREVVIKWISSSDSGERGPEWKRRLEKETLVLSKIDHEHVVRVHDSGADDEHAWLVMEFVEGGTLRDRISETQRLPRSEVRRILSELGSALAALHGLGIVHRDLKPENVLLDGAGRVKVADFGLATPLGDVGNLTVTGQVLGTADYLSPEQKYRLPVDERSDQYSLAVVAYELMTGRKPLGSFSGPSEKDATLSAEVDSVCLRALSEDPEDRFANVTEFVSALDVALAITPKRKLIAHPVPAIAGAVALGILIAGAWGFKDRAPEEPDETLSVSTPVDTDTEENGQPVEIIPGGKTPPILDENGHSEEENREFGRLMALAMQFGNVDQWQESLDKCDEAMQARPESTQVHYNRGCALQALGRLEEAEEAYSLAIHFDSENVYAYCNRGRLRQADQDFEGAIADYERAIRANPAEPLSYENLVQLYKQLGRYGDAVETYEARLEAAPGDLETIGSLAHLLVSSPDKEVVDLERGYTMAEQLCETTEWSHWRPLQVFAIAQHYAGLQADGLKNARRAVELADPRAVKKIRDLLQLYFPNLEND